MANMSTSTVQITMRYTQVFKLADASLRGPYSLILYAVSFWFIPSRQHVYFAENVMFCFLYIVYKSQVDI